MAPHKEYVGEYDDKGDEDENDAKADPGASVEDDEDSNHVTASKFCESGGGVAVKSSPLILWLNFCWFKPF